MTVSIISDRIVSEQISGLSPFFTVLIPTMNRPELVAAALDSVLWQTFVDFEVIVSDNSNDEDSIRKNRATMEKYSNDSRVHYIRPPIWMNMPDHWEFASRRGSGRYVAILTDRYVMRPSALECLANNIMKVSSDITDVVVWNVASGFSKKSGIQHTSLFSGESRTLNSMDILKDYVRLASWSGESMFLNNLPRGINSIYRRDLGEKIRSHHERLFFPFNPDYTSAFLLLAYSKSILEVDLPLYMTHGTQSNGKKCATYGIDSYTSGFTEDPYEDCPLRLNFVFNMIVRDYYFIKKLVVSDLPEIDIVGYFLSCFREIQIKEQYGSPLDIQHMYSIWYQEVAKLNSKQRNSIDNGLIILSGIRPRFVNARKFALRYGIDGYYHNLFDVLRRYKSLLKGETLYANVLMAAQATDKLLDLKKV